MCKTIIPEFTINYSLMMELYFWSLRSIPPVRGQRRESPPCTQTT